MVALFVILWLVGALLILPGWWRVRKRSREAYLLFMLPGAGIILWALLTASGIGAQSLSNVVEVFGVVLAAVISAYLKIACLDRKLKTERSGLIVAFVIVLATTILLRLFTPLLPE